MFVSLGKCKGFLPGRLADPTLVDLNAAPCPHFQQPWQTPDSSAPFFSRKGIGVLDDYLRDLRHRMLEGRLPSSCEECPAQRKVSTDELKKALAVQGYKDENLHIQDIRAALESNIPIPNDSLMHRVTNNTNRKLFLIIGQQ